MVPDCVSLIFVIITRSDICIQTKARDKKKTIRQTDGDAEFKKEAAVGMAAAAASTKVSFLASGTLIRSPLNKNAAESLSSLLSPPPLCWFSNTRGSLSLSLLVFPLRRYGFYLMPRLPYTPPHDQLRMLLRSGNQRMLRRCLSLSVNNLFLFNCETRLLKIIIIIKREKSKNNKPIFEGGFI